MHSLFNNLSVKFSIINIINLSIIIILWFIIIDLLCFTHYSQPLPSLQLISISPNSNTVLPGRYSGKLELINNSNSIYKKIILETSCFCTKVDRSSTINNLKAHSSICIPYHVNCLIPENLDETISATKSNGVLLCQFPITLHIQSPIINCPNQINLPMLYRKSFGYDSECITTKFVIQHSISQLSLIPGLSWLKISSIHFNKHLLICKFYAKQNAPNGIFKTILGIFFVPKDIINIHLLIYLAIFRQILQQFHQIYLLLFLIIKVAR